MMYLAQSLHLPGEEEDGHKDLHDCILASTKTHSSYISREKKHIWDEWEETVQDGAMALLDVEQKIAPVDDPK